MSNLKQKVVRGTVWALMERFSTQIVSFAVGVVLARLLTPTDYGTVALLEIFVALAGVLADSGFGVALIQKKDATEEDFNSVFYFSLSITLMLYVVLFCLAPWVSRFYGIPELKLILRVTSVSLFFNAINSIQNAELNRKMLFNLSFRISLISTFSSAITGISLAYLGYGVWALVWTGIVTGIVGVVSRWFIIAWRPRLMFSWVALKPLFKYGWKMAVSGLLDTGFNNLYGLLIGKFYTRADLSFVNKGRSMPSLIMNNVNGTLGRVAFPALAQLQDDRVKLREAMRRMMVVSTFFVFPLMMLMAVTAEKTILFLYGEKWLPATPYVMIACFTFALWPFHTINLQGIQALGRSDVFLKLEVIKKILVAIVLIAFLSKSVLWWCMASAFLLGPISVALNAWPNRKLLDYSVWMQLRDVLPTAILTGVVAIPVALINFVPLTRTPMALLGCLMGQGILAVVLFAALAFIFRLRGLREVFAIIRSRVMTRFPFLHPVFCYLEGGAI